MQITPPFTLACYPASLPVDPPSATGHNLAKVQKAAGQASIRTTEVYIHLVDDDLSDLARTPTPPTVVNLKQHVAG